MCVCRVATLNRVLVATSDRTLRAAGFRLFGGSHERRYRLGLLEQALRPGRGGVRVAAVEALREGAECVDAEMMERVTAETLASQPPAVAAALASLVGACATLSNVLEVGRALAADGKRRALVLPLIRFVVARSGETGEQLATALGMGHPAVVWAVDGQQDHALPARALDDLGAVDVCEAVYKHFCRRN